MVEASKFHRVIHSLLCSLLVVLLGSCASREPNGVFYGNESLRLTPQQIAFNTKRARAGDVEAAHKLWLHYDFVEDNREKADYWKARYDRLRAKHGVKSVQNHQTKR